MCCLPTLLPQGCDCHGECCLQMILFLVIISGLNLIFQGSPRHPRTLRGSETGPLILKRDKEQGDAEGLKDQGTTQARVSGRRVSRGPLGSQGQQGTLRGTGAERLWGGSSDRYTLLSQHRVSGGAFKVIRVLFQMTVFEWNDVAKVNRIWLT